MEIFILLLLAAITLFFVYYKYKLTYWQRRGIAHDPPQFPLGNVKELRKTKHLIDVTRGVYERYKNTGPYVGFYLMSSPAVIPTDLALIKNILIKDFNNFNSRGIFYNDEDDPLTGNLFQVEDQKWRNLRHKITPTFTSGKMKYMFPTVANVGVELVKVFGEKLDAAENGVIEVTDLVGRYTADVIGTCAFGLECNSLRNPTADFVVMGKRSLIDRKHSMLVDTFLESFPELARKLHFQSIHPEVHDFYMRIVQETVEYREKNKVKRNDFMDLLIEMKNSDGDNKLTMNELVAQAFIFFIAGFETSSTTMGFVLYELAKHPDIQEKLREEINEAYKKHNNKFTYEFVQDLKYLEQVFSETLRVYPVLPELERKAKSYYDTGNPKYYIEKGTMILVPVYAIHHDPDIYPDPEKFDPDRFTEEEIKKRPSCSWLPFGDGPRNCVGLRFGKLQAVIGLAYLIQNFKFSTCKETRSKIEFVIENLLLSAKDGILLKVERV